MKIYIVCDIEGTAGVVDFKNQCDFEGKYFQQAQRMATLELNAVIEGALEGGATEIYAWPGHGPFPGGIDVELVHPDCKLVMHAGDAGPIGIDDSFDAMLLCGLHAMAGIENGVLAHSFMPLLTNMWINGLKIGEIGMNMAVFGQFNIPTVFISGDHAAVEEARQLVLEIEGAVVKWGLEEKRKLGALSECAAISLAPEAARNVLREAARKAMDKVDHILPFKLEAPYSMKVQYLEGKYAEHLINQEEITQIDEITFEQVRDNLSELIF